MPMQKTSQEIKMYDLLKKNRRKWVSVRDLQKVSNSMCVSTVLSNLRRRYDLVIDNKEERQKKTGMVFSRYKLVRGSVKK